MTDTPYNSLTAQGQRIFTALELFTDYNKGYPWTKLIAMPIRNPYHDHLAPLLLGRAAVILDMTGCLDSSLP